MNTINEITKAIRNSDFFFNTKSSTYTMVEDVLVRVSDHLPNKYNLISYNEDVQKVFLIFAETELTEREVSNYIDEELRSFDVDYIIIDGSFDYTLDNIKNFINQL
jgi:hypothetical protein